MRPQNSCVAAGVRWSWRILVAVWIGRACGGISASAAWPAAGRAGLVDVAGWDTATVWRRVGGLCGFARSDGPHDPD